MFVHDRRAPVIPEVGFTKLADNLFFLGVEGEMLPDPEHFLDQKTIIQPQPLHGLNRSSPATVYRNAHASLSRDRREVR